MKSNQQGKGLSSIIILFIIAAAIGLGVYLFFQQRANLSFPEISSPKVQTPLNSEVDAIEISFPKLEISSFQSYPIAERFEVNSKENNIYKITLIPLKPMGKSIKTDIETEVGSGNAMNININEPIPSPDFTVTAFIQNSNLWLISADGKNKVKLPDNLKVNSIAGWSPDSRKLLIYSSPEDIETMFYGIGEPEGLVNFNLNRLPAGFYLVDLGGSMVRFLYPLTPGKFLGWINQEKLMFTLKDSIEEKFLIFDINNFAADTKTMKNFVDTYKDVWAKDHMSFSRDGQKWVISLGDTGNDTTKPSFSQIIIADFPSPYGNIIDQGGWADFQSPFISPDGKNLVYTKHEPPSGWHLIVWDGRDKRRIENSRFKAWVGSDSVIYAKRTNDTNYSKYYLHNLTNAQETPLN